MSKKRKEDLYSIGAIYGDMLNSVKTQIVKEEKTVPPGVVGDAPLEAGGGTERGGFEPSVIDIYKMSDKEKDDNLYNIKGLTYGDGNDPGMENQQSQPTGPEFGQVSYTGNVGGPEEDEEGGFEGQPEPTPKAKAHREFRDKYPQRYGPQFHFDDSTGNWHASSGGKVIYRSESGDVNEEDEEFLSEHEKNARNSLNNFMAKQSVFDKLYNKVMISEQGPYAAGLEGEEVQETDFEELEALGIESEEPEDITVTLPSDLAQTLCDIIQAALEDQQIDVETEVDVEVDETVDFEEDAETAAQKTFGGNKGDRPRKFDKKTGRKSELRDYGGKRGKHPKAGAEEDEEAAMKDGGGYGMDAGSTLKKEINYGKKNRVGKLRPATGLAQKDGGGYGMDAGSTLSKEVNYGKQNKVGTLSPGPIPGA